MYPCDHDDAETTMDGQPVDGRWIDAQECYDTDDEYDIEGDH